MDRIYNIQIEPQVDVGLEEESREKKRDTKEIVNDVLRATVY